MPGCSMSITNSQSLLKFMSIKSVMSSNHLILCHPPLLLPSIFPSIRVFSNELALHIRWQKYCSFSFSISPSSEYSGLTGLISLQSQGLSRVFFNTTAQKHQLFSHSLMMSTCAGMTESGLCLSQCAPVPDHLGISLYLVCLL